MRVVIDNVRGRIWRNGKLQDDFDIESLSDCLADDTTLAWADLVNPTHETLCTAGRRTRSQHLGRGGRTRRRRAGQGGQLPAPQVHHGLRRGHATPTRRCRRNGALHIHRISMFIKDNVLITVRLSDDFDMDVVTAALGCDGRQQHGIGALVHGLLDVVVDRHFDAVQIARRQHRGSRIVALRREQEQPGPAATHLPGTQEPRQTPSSGAADARGGQPDPAKPA